jgi:hypothetical protein
VAPQTLMDAFKFSAADLAANRSGNMTDAQKLVLRDQQQFYFVSYGLFSAIFFVVFIASIVHFDSYSNSVLLTSVMMTLISGGLFLNFTFMLITKVRKVQIDITEATIASVAGRLSFYVINSRNVIYQIEIKDVRLNITQKAKTLLTQGQSYAVYYAPKSHIVLAIVAL